MYLTMDEIGSHDDIEINEDDEGCEADEDIHIRLIIKPSLLIIICNSFYRPTLINL